jgi:hypothetical protein
MVGRKKLIDACNRLLLFCQNNGRDHNPTHGIYHYYVLKEQDFLLLQHPAVMDLARPICDRRLRSFGGIKLYFKYI